MLPSKLKLKDKKLIADVFETGRVRKTPLFNIYYKNTFPPPQLLTVVSNKISKKATQRNLIRRRVQGIFRDALVGLDSPIKVVLVIKKQISKKDAPVVKEALEEILVRK